MYRMNFIQSALNKYMSQVSDALFSDIFGPFLESVGTPKVENTVKNRKNWDFPMILKGLKWVSFSTFQQMDTFGAIATSEHIA